MKIIVIAALTGAILGMIINTVIFFSPRFRAKPLAPFATQSGEHVTTNGEKDREDIYTEVDPFDHSRISDAMMWALRSDYHYKWVELRAKPGDPTKLLVVRHTMPNPELAGVSNGMN